MKNKREKREDKKAKEGTGTGTRKYSITLRFASCRKREKRGRDGRFKNLSFPGPSLPYSISIIHTRRNLDGRIIFAIRETAIEPRE